MTTLRVPITADDDIAAGFGSPITIRQTVPCLYVEIHDEPAGTVAKIYPGDSPDPAATAVHAVGASDQDVIDDLLNNHHLFEPSDLHSLVAVRVHPDQGTASAAHKEKSGCGPSDLGDAWRSLYMVRRALPSKKTSG